MGILQELENQLKGNQSGNPVGFFPTSNVLLPAARFPLLAFINDKNNATPSFPLTISAVKSLLESAADDELNTLRSQFFNAIKGHDPAATLKQIFAGLRALGDQIVTQIATLASHQLVIGASLIPIVSALKPANLDAVFTAQSQYFFGHVDGSTTKTTPGYVTIANEIIAPPELPTAQSNSVPDLKIVKSYFSKKTGEQYVRDLTRIGFEAIANNVWKLETRYAQIGTNAAVADPNVKINDAAKAQTWFKGFADFAESSVTAAVEQALQGGGPMQTNPLFAAGIATASGTAARKAAQHIFLREIGIP
jgi:hypothetical protein